ncbi:major surface protease gp63 [Novymonas esmeraldas]|uniref:Leishmanolysin-like peptidase n=1 Tax=Novymonas esmeraldas TaxID=1808958 RepID=A0AAW0F0D6_9TRYP
MRRSLLRTAVAAVLVCAVVWSSAAQPSLEPADVEEHRWDIDALPARTVSTRVAPGSRVADTAGQPQVVTAPPDWTPIRIAVFAYDVANSSRYCTKAGQLRPDMKGGVVTCWHVDVLTDTKKHTLLEFMIPSAVRMHEERLSVQRESGNIVVDRDTFEDSSCRHFSIPAAHMSEGVANADFLLYVAAGPIPSLAIAWAASCQYFANGRPSVGVANVSPRYMTSDLHNMRAVVHEILHALGFNSHVLFEQDMVAYADSLRGKSDVPVIASPMVVAQARAHFGCKTQTFLELEDMGGEGAELSHWKPRSMKDDLMAGLAGSGLYSAITIAAMEDMGFYKGNYAMAEPMMNGRNAGCGLLTEKCVAISVSQFPSMFCASRDVRWRCTSHRLGVGDCQVKKYPSSLPPQFRYLADSALGGISDQMDYCPFVQAFIQSNCTVDGRLVNGSVYGAMSRCLDAPAGFTVGGQSSAQYGLCADVKCASATYSVKVRGEKAFTTCKPGTTLTLSSLSSKFSDGHITCPSYDSVCGMRVNVAQYDRYGASLTDSNGAGASAGMTAALAVAAAALVVSTT